MNINATLIGQMITFGIFVWFTMKYVWPPVMKAMDERKKKIADGLEAAERGVRELALAERKAQDLIAEAKVQAAGLLDQANKRSVRMVEEAKNEARAEGERMIVVAREEIERESHLAREKLREEVARLAILGAEKILQSKINAQTDAAIIDKMIAEI